MSLLPFAVFNGLLLCAAASDLRSYRIPNLLAGLVAATGLLLALPTTFGEAGARLASVALVAAIAGPLWLRGWLGGGDLKLLVACAIWIPPGGLGVFGTALGLASGVQGLATLALVRIGPSATFSTALRRRLPYAVSIAAAGMVWSSLALLARG